MLIFNPFLSSHKAKPLDCRNENGGMERRSGKEGLSQKYYSPIIINIHLG